MKSVVEKIKLYSTRVWKHLCSWWKLYEISPGELFYILLMFFLMLIMNYFLIALHGFSLSYSKQWPDASCLDNVFWLLLLLTSGHFLVLRGRWYLWTLTTIHFLVLFCLLAIYLTTGTFFCESVLYLVYDTTWEETRGFFTAYVKFWHVLALAGVFLLYFGGLFFAGKLYRGKKRFSRGDFLAAATVILISLWPISVIWRDLFLYHPFNGIYGHIRIFNQHAGGFVVEMRHRTPPDFVALRQELKREAPIGVLVIGESAIRSHHSIYGYERNTTPNLLRYQRDIVAFDNTVAVLPMTITALKYWLTDMTLDNRHVSWTIFDALKCAGYKVDVITNQNKSGWADSPLQMIFSTADSISYMHEENFSDLTEDRNAQIYDANLLPPFNEWLKKAQQNQTVPQLAVIHLFGSHDPFASRYPKGFGQEFLNDTSKSQLVNEYDASVLYSDMVLGRMLDELNKLERPVYLIYLSDHGSVCESSGLRTPGSVENSAYEIPFLVWTNIAYQKLMPNTVAQMKKQRSVPLQADRAHFGLLEVMGIEFPEKYEKCNFLSDKFELVPRTVREGAYPYVSAAEIMERANE